MRTCTPQVKRNNKQTFIWCLVSFVVIHPILSGSRKKNARLWWRHYVSIYHTQYNSSPSKSLCRTSATDIEPRERKKSKKNNQHSNNPSACHLTLSWQHWIYNVKMLNQVVVNVSIIYQHLRSFKRFKSQFLALFYTFVEKKRRQQLKYQGFPKHQIH